MSAREDYRWCLQRLGELDQAVKAAKVLCAMLDRPHQDDHYAMAEKLLRFVEVERGAMEDTIRLGRESGRFPHEA